MKKLILVLMLNSLVSFSQTREELELCFVMQTSGFMSNSEAENALQKILDVIGAKKNFVLSSCSDIQNAVATSYKGVRYILYDKKFIQNLNLYSNDWTGMTVLAHEVGHHINGHAVDIGLYLSKQVEPKTLAKKRQQELEADEFAGFVMARLGASLTEIQNGIAIVSSEGDDTYSTHPSKSKRLRAIEIGYNRAKQNSTSARNVYTEKTKNYNTDVYDVKIQLLEKDAQKTYDLQVAANDAYNREEYKKASSLYSRAYAYGHNLDVLYYSAVSSINGGDYPTALKSYLFLFQKGYTGITEKYFVTYKKNGETVQVSESEYQSLRNSKKIIDSKVSLSESVRPNIIKSIGLLYDNLGYQESALQFVTQALQSSPNDIDLILTVANISFRQGNMDKYKGLVKKALALEPNNATLYYNLGVVSSELGEKKDAENYYNKAIRIDPSMQNAYLNLVSLILEQEKTIVEEMNSLGYSEKDEKRYDELYEIRKNIYMRCVPILKKLINIDARNNLEAIETLKNIYVTIGNNRGAGEMVKLLNRYR